MNMSVIGVDVVNFEYFSHADSPMPVQLRLRARGMLR
jgi:hypothetical protein